MKYFVAFIICLFSASALAAADKTNLLSLQALTLERDHSSGIDFSEEKRMRDGDETSSISIKTKNRAPVELVFFFGGETVSPHGLNLKTSGIKTGKASVEVLVSTQSPAVGFGSLRVEPIVSTKKWQKFKFEQSAAKWVLIKITPFEKDVNFKLLELDLQGHVGPPVTVYKFDEAPADAFAVLEKLKSSVDVVISEDEASLFADAKDGKLDDWSFAEAALLSSGVLDRAKRKKLLKQIDDLETNALQSIQPQADVYAKGKSLLGWLHASSFKSGYRSKQTNVSTVLKNNTYNCVSSATLYNILAKRMGMDVRGIEVPDHAFSILYDGTKHVDIETTTKNGFNPARNKAGLSEFEKKTGFVYIRDKHRSKRREIDDVGLVALTYYNHGVGLYREKKYYAALLSYFKALSLDPANKSAVKNALAVLSNWSSSLLKQGEFDQALAILETGLELAPEDRNLKHNYKVAWEKKVITKIDAGESDAAVATLALALRQTGDKRFQRMRSWVYTRPGEKKIANNEWEAALEIAETGLKSSDAAVKKEIFKWRSGIILRWSNRSLKSKDFAVAVDVLERGLRADPNDRRVKNNLAYIAQEWSAHVNKTEGVEAGKKIVLAMANRFPDLNKVQKVIGRFSDLEARKAAKKGDFEAALAIYAAAQIEQPDNKQLKRNARATWDKWAKGYMKKKEWGAALDVYEKAVAADPNAGVFKQNIAYVVQEWGRAVAKQEGVIAAETLIASLADRFPDVSKVSAAKGRIVSDFALKATKAGKFEDAVEILIKGGRFFATPAKYDRIVVNVYYNWGNKFTKQGKWQEAVSIYDTGRKAHPNNSKLKRNAIATWHGWAEIHMDKGEWQQAIDIYQHGLDAMPGTRLFKQNIRYCQSKL